MPEIVVSRSAVCGPDLSVAGYEVVTADVPAGTRLRLKGSETIGRAALLSMGDGIGRMAGSCDAFVGADPGLFSGRVPLGLPPRRAVVVVPASWPADAAPAGGCRLLRGRGYRLALSGLGAAGHPLLPLASFASVGRAEAKAMGPGALAALLAACRAAGARTIACGLADAGALAAARAAGFDLFQGPELSRPRVVAGRTVETAGLAHVRLAASMVGDEFEYDDLERILRTDPGLTARLLRLASAGANSGAKRDVRTIRDALVLIGSRRLQSWSALLLLAQPGAASERDVAAALARARMVELLAGCERPFLAGLGFTAGMVSAFDLVLGVPAPEIRAAVRLSDDLADAAFGTESAVGRIVRDTILYLDGADSPIGLLSGLAPAEFHVASIRALLWAVEATGGMDLA